MAEDLQAVGDLFKDALAVKKTRKPQKARKAPPVKPSDHKLLNAALAITEDPDAVERAYMARELVQVTLPHSDPGNVPAWVRRNGNQALVIQPGIMEVRDDGQVVTHGYPHGTIPRLLLFWVVTEATRTKSRKVYLSGDSDGSNSLASFMRQLGMNPDNGTGKRSDRHRLRTAVTTLFSAKISFQETSQVDKAIRERRTSMDIASASEMWWSTKRGGEEQESLWRSWVLLGEHFFEAVTAAPVPVDMRILRALKSSALALDLYAWVCHKSYTVNRAGRPSVVPWTGLMQQMGAEYSDPKDFAKKASAALAKIKTLWPKDKKGMSGLRLEVLRGRVQILPGSVLSVPERDYLEGRT